MLAIHWTVKMARFNDNAAKGEHVAAALVGRVDPDGFIAEVNR